MKDMKNRLKSRRGETLTELLIAAVIVAFATALMAGMVSASSNMITQSRDRFAGYYVDVGAAVNGNTNEHVSGFTTNVVFSEGATSVYLYETGDETGTGRTIPVSCFQTDTGVVCYELPKAGAGG